MLESLNFGKRLYFQLTVLQQISAFGRVHILNSLPNILICLLYKGRPKMQSPIKRISISMPYCHHVLLWTECLCFLKTCVVKPKPHFDDTWPLGNDWAVRVMSS